MNDCNEEGYSSPMPNNPQCRICKTEQNISRCKGCQSVFYCGRQHQTIHWNAHKGICSRVKKTRTKLEREIETLNNMPSDFGFQEKPFENSVGHFWGILDTRNYMRARYAHAEALLAVNNRTAVGAALGHFLDMLRLNRSDNMGVRSIIPALFLRLNKDQECYDFIKWWYKNRDDDHYDWGNIDLPYLDIKNADVLEVDKIDTKWDDLSHMAMLCLLKWRLFTELKQLDNATIAARGKLPIELIDQIRSTAVSPTIKNNKPLMQDIESGRDISRHIKNLEQQVDTLFKAVKHRNGHYWDGVLNPGGHLEARPPFHSPGSVEEMQLSLSMTFEAWLETPGALQWIISKLTS